MSSCSDDGRGGSISPPQAENKKYQSVGTRSRVTRRGRRSRVPRKYLYVAFAACVVPQLRPRYRLLDAVLEAACTAVLFAWHVAAFELHSCGCESPKRLKTTRCVTPQL